MVGRHRPPAAHVPTYVMMPYLTAEGAGGPPQPGFLGGWLGKSHDPFLRHAPSTDRYSYLKRTVMAARYIHNTDRLWSPLTGREALWQSNQLQKLAACVSDRELVRRLEEQAGQLMAQGRGRAGNVAVD